MKPHTHPRSSLALAIILLACAFASAGQASESLAKLTMIPDDPASTFSVGTVFGQEPFQQVEVGFYVDSDSVMTQFGADLRWSGEKLSLVSVVAGPGLPAGSTFTPTPGDSSLGLICTLPSGGEQLPSGEAIFVMTFETACYGFATRADISFFEDAGSNNNSFFNAGGISYSPATANGGVQSSSNYQFVTGEDVEALPLAPEATWHVNLYNTVTSRLTTVEVLYDESLLSVTDVVAGTELAGATLDFAAANGVLTVDIDGDFLPGGSHELLGVVFSLDTPDDGYTTSLAFGPGCVAETECGPSPVNGALGGGISVPEFSATSTIQNVSVYRTASWFLVPVKIDANMPVHGYSLYMNYPPDPPGDITYLDIQTTGVDAPEVLYNEAEGRLYFDLPDRPAPYFGSGVQEVFKIKFGLASGQSAGTQHHIDFDLSRANRIAHIVSDGTIHEATPLTLVDGTVTLTNPPVTCPALSVWDGEGYRFENNILAACDGVKSDQDVVEYYTLQTNPATTPDGLKLRLTEDADDVTSFRDLSLIAVDHPSDQRIQVDRDGNVVVLGHAIGLVSARDQQGRDVTQQLLAPDQDAYRSDEPGWLELSFGRVPLLKGETMNLAGLGNPPPKDNKRLAKLADGSNRLRVFLRDASGEWRLTDEVGARERSVRQATFFSASQLVPGQELSIRLEWDRAYSLDVFELSRTRPFDGTTFEIDPTSVLHSVEGEVGNRLGKTLSEGTTLAPGQQIDLSFDAAALGALEEGMVRDFVLRAEGHYNSPSREPVSELRFALGEASPNPFNPSTQISYSLAEDGMVRLNIHDARGALVRTLVHEYQSSGTRSVVWNGRDDRGHAVSSGVYFYVLESGAKKASHKMLLVK